MRLRARGVRNIDVGCMQINLHHHPRAFDSLEEAFDPAANIAYAGTFLRRLERETRSWSRAVAYYHSKTANVGAAYRQRVMDLWPQLRRRAALALRAERIEAYNQRRAERLRRSVKRPLEG